MKTKALGLKDHQIQELVNAICTAVAPITPYQCLRELIANSTIQYLETNGLRIDSPKDIKSKHYKCDFVGSRCVNNPFTEAKFDSACLEYCGHIKEVR